MSQIVVMRLTDHKLASACSFGQPIRTALIKRLSRRKAKSSMRCSSVYGRLSIDISSKGFSTLLAMILLTPQHPLNRLSNLTRRPRFSRSLCF
ncbi:hypothetical protein HFO61_34805 [Rhizobium leguminosarum]|uniref:hypothetical protein n=1 Tax=Rhizobium leguminosarum TaxID=384 RepID=UPI001C96CCD7|nr:hypothetical protein [Rhizobium leguminosarum]MBY5551862.1 hypothetical protein [Rhizobium leguminosarum]MBY5592876.1 hypothetical protein [Rhizobium leguminosarum]MBY5606477.1 hypothetical protein [Rhizobium leguminosarum]